MSLPRPRLTLVQTPGEPDVARPLQEQMLEIVAHSPDRLARRMQEKSRFLKPIVEKAGIALD